MKSEMMMGETVACELALMTRRRLIVGAFLAATLAIVGSNPAPAQTFPSRPVTIVVPFAAGGPIDTLARVLAERMRAPLGQPVVIENVSGAAGSIGVGRDRRRRQSAARRWRLLPECDRHPLSVRTLPRRRARHAGPGGRTDRLDIRRPDHLPAAGAQRQHQGLCGDRQEPPRGGPGYSDGRRGRIARVLLFCLERVVCAERYAPRYHREAQRSRRRGAGGTRSAPAARR